MAWETPEGGKINHKGTKRTTLYSAPEGVRTQRIFKKIKEEEFNHR
jgi:hypothetical protein